MDLCEAVNYLSRSDKLILDIGKLNIKFISLYSISVLYSIISMRLDNSILQKYLSLPSYSLLQKQILYFLCENIIFEYWFVL